jgi:hypothetical protein
MFEKSKEFYDAIYAGKDYKSEAAQLKPFIALVSDPLSFNSNSSSASSF